MAQPKKGKRREVEEKEKGRRKRKQEMVPNSIVQWCVPVITFYIQRSTSFNKAVHHEKSNFIVHDCSVQGRLALLVYCVYVHVAVDEFSAILEKMCEEKFAKKS